jgi:TadE-like protein
MRPLYSEESGAVFAEFAMLLPLLIFLVCGSIDFLYAFYQWNAAAKAVEVGARIASVSDPVARGLYNLSNQPLINGALPGSPVAVFNVNCHAGSCSCAGICAGLAVNSFDAAAMNRIVFGRNSDSCGDARSYYDSGMCDILSSITSENVTIAYTQTGLGFVGRPGGPTPTVTVSLQDMQFKFFFLSSLFGFGIAMPNMATTMTAEDLCSGGRVAACGS